jgi:hypothetical protein
VTPEQEEQVRRALGAVARAEDGPETQGLPPDVAERLDDVLHELVTERAGRSDRPTVPGPAGADELVARRHRRWPTVLVAAAAVAVIAAAGGAVATRGFGDGAESSSAGSSPDRVASGSAGIATPSGAAAGSVPNLSSRTLARDIRNVAARPRSFMAPRDRGRDLATLPRPDHVRCGRPDTPRGADVVAVYLDGLPGTLVLTPATGGTRVARVYSCAVPPALVRTLYVRASG